MRITIAQYLLYFIWLSWDGLYYSSHYIDEKIETQRGEMTYPKWHNESHLRYNGCSDSIAWAVHCHARERRAEEGEGAGDGNGKKGGREGEREAGNW